MKTFFEEIEERKNNCKTIEDWQAAYEWLSKEAKEMNEDAVSMENAIVEKYGEDALDELIEMVLASDKENELTPSMQEMIAYGYTELDILPVNKDTADEFFEKQCNVYLLNTNNTKRKVASKEEIASFDGIVGISVDEIAEKMASDAGFSMEPDR